MGEDLVGQTLGGYQIESVIASSATATVYKGTHPHLERPVAIKTLHAEGAAREELTKRFYREGRFIAKLHHSNIAEVFDLGCENDIHYLAMELVPGRQLNTIIEDSGALAPARALEIAGQVADALTAAHKHNIVHRDIKPDNIMVDDGDTIMVMDFGIAKDLDEQSMLTQVGTTVGTRFYMSPEQIKGGDIDHRADIYALGVVLFEMLTGRLPYAENLPFLDLMTKIVEGPFPSPKVVNPEITETVERIVARMTTTDPAERYESAQELSDDIRFCLRIKAYEQRPEGEAAGGFINPFKKLFSASAKPGEEIERSEIQRRRDDRTREDDFAKLKAESAKRHKDGRLFRRITIRRKATAVLHQNVERVENLAASTSPINTRLLDIGNGGVAFLLRSKLEKGDRHTIVLQLGDGQVVRTPGRVAWRRHFPELEAYAVGFEFLDTPQADKDRLPEIILNLSERDGF